MQGSRSHQQQGGLGLSLATRPVWPNGDIHSADEIITSRSGWVNEPRRIGVSKSLIERAARALSWVTNALMLRNIGRRFYSAMEMIDTRLHLGMRGGEGDDMFCRKCGAEMEGGARFCPKCGLPVADASEESLGEFEQGPDDADEASGQLVSVEDEGEPTGSVAASPEPAEGSSTGKVFGLESDSADADAEGAVAPARSTRPRKPFIIAVIVAVLLVLGGSGYYFGVVAPERAREAAEQEALAAEYVVRVSVSAEGWDTAAGASRVPLRVKGREERGKKVNKVYYVDSAGAGLKLRRGTYAVIVAGSPIAADGTIYAVPDTEIEVKVDEKSAAKKGGVDATGDAVTLDPVPATDVTDEQIADAKKWAEGDKGAADADCTFDAEALATAAAKRRDDAAAAKKAGEEAAKRAEEAKQARTIDTDYFTMVLPDWFPIDEFEYKTEERSDYGGGTGNWSVTYFIRNGDANDNADFMIVTYEQGMPGYGCGYAKELGSSKGRTVQLLVGGVTAQEALGMSLEDYGDALSACITLK